jgi:hypothetical protein
MANGLSTETQKHIHWIIFHERFVVHNTISNSNQIEQHNGLLMQLDLPIVNNPQLDLQNATDFLIINSWISKMPLIS